jgi:hypothetical protein
VQTKRSGPLAVQLLDALVSWFRFHAFNLRRMAALPSSKTTIKMIKA